MNENKTVENAFGSTLNIDKDSSRLQVVSYTYLGITIQVDNLLSWKNHVGNVC